MLCMFGIRTRINYAANTDISNAFVVDVAGRVCHCVCECLCARGRRPSQPSCRTASKRELRNPGRSVNRHLKSLITHGSSSPSIRPRIRHHKLILGDLIVSDHLNVDTSTASQVVFLVFFNCNATGICKPGKYYIYFIALFLQHSINKQTTKPRQIHCTKHSIK